jgi:2'-5' RNA ligase
MRLFIGSFFEDEQTLCLHKMQHCLKPFLDVGRLVHPNNLHFTWLFLGEVDEGNIPFIREALGQTTEKHDAVSTSFCDVQNFSKGATVAMMKAAKPFLSIQSNIAKRLTSVAATEQKYTPHATLIRGAKFSLPFSEVKKSVTVFNRPFEVTNISLISVTSAKQQAVYTPIETYLLKQ